MYSSTTVVFTGVSFPPLYQLGAHLARVASPLFPQTLATRLSVRFKIFVSQTLLAARTNSLLRETLFFARPIDRASFFIRFCYGVRQELVEERVERVVVEHRGLPKVIESERAFLQPIQTRHRARMFFFV